MIAGEAPSPGAPEMGKALGGDWGELPAVWGFGSLPAMEPEKKKFLLRKKPTYFE